LSTVGTVYDSLGQYRDALPLLNEALQLQEQAHDNARVETLLELGRAYIGAGDLPAAEAPLQQALHLAQSDAGPNSVATGHALWTLGMLRFQQGQISQAKELYIRSLAILESGKAPETDVSPVLSDLAAAYIGDQQWPLAKQAYEQALEIDRRVLGGDHPKIAFRLQNLAIVAQNSGELKEAEALYRDALQREERTYGDRHPETAVTKGNYGLLLQREGRLAEAEPLLRDAVSIQLILYGPEHYKVGYARVSLAILLHAKGDLAGSESEFRQALAIYDKSLPANHQYRAALLMHFARLLVDRGKYTEALAKSEESIGIWSATLPASSAPVAQAHAIHAYALEHLDRSREAAEELDAAVPVLVKTRGADDSVTRRAQLWLAVAHPVSAQTASAAR
jgi:tetratricopeptide (TPR) repeat protein